MSLYSNGTLTKTWKKGRKKQRREEKEKKLSSWPYINNSSRKCMKKGRKIPRQYDRDQENQETCLPQKTYTPRKSQRNNKSLHLTPRTEQQKPRVRRWLSGRASFWERPPCWGHSEVLSHWKENTCRPSARGEKPSHCSHTNLQTSQPSTSRAWSLTQYLPVRKTHSGAFPPCVNGLHKVLQKVLERLST